MLVILEDLVVLIIYCILGDFLYLDFVKFMVLVFIVFCYVIFRDWQIEVIVILFVFWDEVFELLLCYFSDQFSKEIEGGDIYFMMEFMLFDKFVVYWFQNFVGIMLLGNIESVVDVIEGKDWFKECFGIFYIKFNYFGCSSYICNVGFIVIDVFCNCGVGWLMGEMYFEWVF